MVKDWDAEEFREYLMEHRDEYEPIFWSGYSENEFGETIYANDVAADWEIMQPEWKTVATSVDDAGFDQNDPDIDWKKASEIFAEESSGTAHIFIGDKCDYENNTWNNIEHDIIIANDKIDKVERVDLVSQSRNSCNKKDIPKPHNYPTK